MTPGCGWIIPTVIMDTHPTIIIMDTADMDIPITMDTLLIHTILPIAIIGDIRLLSITATGPPVEAPVIQVIGVQERTPKDLRELVVQASIPVDHSQCHPQHVL